MTVPKAQEAQQKFEQMFQRSYRRAYHLAYRLTGNATDAEDVLQDAYLRAWNHFERYDPTRSFEGWLLRILTNRALDLRRRKKRVQMLPLDMLLLDEGLLASHGMTASHESPQHILLNRFLNEQLQQAIAALPETNRTALMLNAVEQCSYQEIADITGCALGTVRSRIHRGRQMLQRTLENRQLSGALGDSPKRAAQVA